MSYGMLGCRPMMSCARRDQSRSDAPLSRVDVEQATTASVNFSPGPLEFDRQYATAILAHRCQCVSADQQPSRVDTKQNFARRMDTDQERSLVQDALPQLDDTSCFRGDVETFPSARPPNVDQSQVRYILIKETTPAYRSNRMY